MTYKRDNGYTKYMWQRLYIQRSEKWVYLICPLLGYSHIRSVRAALQGRQAGKGSSVVFSHSVQAACTLARCVDEE